jgi:hypothetical protein
LQPNTGRMAGLVFCIRVVMKRIPVPPGHKVFTLDICDAIKGHLQCPGFATLSAGGIDLGPVACNCKCHKNPMTDVVVKAGRA